MIIVMNIGSQESEINNRSVVGAELGEIDDSRWIQSNQTNMPLENSSSHDLSTAALYKKRPELGLRKPRIGFRIQPEKLFERCLKLRCCARRLVRWHDDSEEVLDTWNTY